MSNNFASGKKAIAECDRCGFTYKLKELKQLVIKTKNVNILVCPTCYEEDQPQLQLGMYPVQDPQALRNPRPDQSYYTPQGVNGGDGGSRIYQWGWNPVGYRTINDMFVSSMYGTGINGTNLTPVGVTNDLVGYGSVGVVSTSSVPSTGTVITTDSGIVITTDDGTILTTDP